MENTYDVIVVGAGNAALSAAIAAKVDFMTVYEWEKIFSANYK